MKQLILKLLAAIFRRSLREVGWEVEQMAKTRHR